MADNKYNKVHCNKGKLPYANEVGRKGKQEEKVVVGFFATEFIFLTRAACP